MTVTNTLTYSEAFVSYANYTPSQCFSLAPEQQVDCSAQMLNATNPPSEYTFAGNTPLWGPIWCLLYNATLTHRVEAFQGSFNYCAVPLRGADGFLFVSLALLATAVLFGKLSTVWVLIVGGILGIFNYYFNLLELSNAVSIWLSIQPADLFFYAFLPPLLVEQAIRIDYFMFGKIWVHALYMAFVMVVLSAIALTPFILFALGFSSRGWSWVHGALFSAIIAPTDALAVGSILKRANGPERIVTIMEGESLFNDASAITLFEVFLHLIEKHTSENATGWPSVWEVIPTILLDIVRLSAVGFGIGLVFSWATGHILRWLRWRGAQPYIETTVVLAVAYLSFYVAASPAEGSGVIAVVVFGLYGNATSKWGMLGSAEESGAFDAVWDMISFAANGLVFFWSGVASINFTIRSIMLFHRTVYSFIAVVFIYLFMLVFRTLCMGLGNPLFIAVGERLSAAEIFFVGWSGLRGSVSLIMVSAFATGSSLSFENVVENGEGAVNSDISLWASLFVFLTLVINGPGIAPILRLLKLDFVPLGKRKNRAKAKRALCRFTERQVDRLRDDDGDELMQGANWDAVRQYVDMSKYFRSEEEPLKKDMAGDKRKSIHASEQHKDAKSAWEVTKVLSSAMVSGLGSFCHRCCSFRLKPKTLLKTKPSTGDMNSMLGSKSRRGSSGGFGGESQPPPKSILKKKKTTDAVPITENATAVITVTGVTSRRTTLSEPSSQQQNKAAYLAPTLHDDAAPTHTAAGGVIDHHHMTKNEDDDDNASHDAWSDVSAQELANELEEECPFLPETHAEKESKNAMAATEYQRALNNVSHASPSGSSSSPGGADHAHVDVESGLANPPSAMSMAGQAIAIDMGGHVGQSPTVKISNEGTVLLETEVQSKGVQNLETITEGKAVHHDHIDVIEPSSSLSAAAALDDQLCISGPTGAKLLDELRKSLTQNTATTTTTRKKKEEEEEQQQDEDVDYYSTMPEHLGSKLQKELASQVQFISNNNTSDAHDIAVAGTDQGSATPSTNPILSQEPAFYYSSLPTVVGRSLQKELRDALKKSKQSQTQTESEMAPQKQKESSPPSTSPHQRSISTNTGDVPAATATTTTRATATADTNDTTGISYYSSLPISSRSNLQQELRRHISASKSGSKSPLATSTPTSPALSPSASYASLPAALGKSMRSRLQQQLSLQQQPPSAAVTTDGNNNSPRQRLARVSATYSQSSDGTVSSVVHDEWDSYHATVSGVMGSNLAAEVRQHVQHAPAHGAVTHDLLGRKMSKRKHEKAPSFGAGGSTPPRGDGGMLLRHEVASHAPPLASALLRAPSRSHQHPLPSSRHHARHLSLQRTPRPGEQEGIGGASALSPFAATSNAQQSTIYQERNFLVPVPPFLQDNNTSNNDKGAVVPERSFRQTKSLSTRREKNAAALNFGSRSMVPMRDRDDDDMTNSAVSLLSRTYSMGSSLHKMTSHKPPRPSMSKTRTNSAVKDEVGADQHDRTLKKTVGGGVVPEQHRASMSESPGTSSCSTNTLDEGYDNTEKDNDDDDPHGGDESGDYYYDGGYGDGGEYAAYIDQEEADGDMAERRSRVLAGLKRHFVGKRLAGLLSVDGLRILTYSCDKAADDATEPLRLWASLEKEIGGRLMTRWCSRMSLSMTRWYRAMPSWLQKVFSWPYKKFAGVLRRYVGRQMLVACEVAVEYYLALKWSPQIQWLKTHADECWHLLNEVESESEAAYRFIIEKEIEAPDRFQAIQSYRAAMALLRQQMLFIDELFETGMLDHGEHHDMTDPVEKKMRRLEIIGPVWRPPPPKNVLRGISFMASLPDAIFKRFWSSGELCEYRSGQCIWSASNIVKKTGGTQGPGGFVVLSGVVKRVYIRPDGTKKEYYQAAGGVVGVLLAMTGTKLPGTELAIAEGNTLGKGPIVFHVPQPFIHQFIIQGARENKAIFVHLERELLRLSAAYVVESMENILGKDIIDHVTSLLTKNRIGKKTTTMMHSGGSGPISSLSRHSSGNLQHAQQQRAALLSRRSSGELLALSHGGRTGSAGDSVVQQRRTTFAPDTYRASTPPPPGGSVSAPALLPPSSPSHIPAAAVPSGGGGAVSGGSMAPLPHQPLILPGTGLPTSKSVGTNLADLMNDIARLEYEESDDEDDGVDNNMIQSSQRGGSLEEEEGEYHARIPEDGPARARTVSTAQQQQQQQHRRLSRVSMIYDAQHTLNIQEAVAERAPQLVADIMLEIRRGLHMAFVLRLNSNTEFVQTSHAVLLAGDVQEHKKIDGGDGEIHDAKKGFLISAPRVLPWLWEEHQLCNLGSQVEMQRSINWRTGDQGATLVVCHNSNGLVPQAVLDYNEAQEDEAQRAERAMTLSSFPLDGDDYGGGGAGGEGEGGLGGGDASIGGSGGDIAAAAAPETEHNSIMGAAAATMGRELGSMINRLRRIRTAPAGRRSDGDIV